jgi:accessory gene regulator protein AgrB
MNNLHIEQDLIPRKQYEQLKESYDYLVIRFGILLIFWRIVLISIIFIIIYFLSKLVGGF